VDFVSLTLTDDRHARVCLAIVLGFVEPQPSMHRRADRLFFGPAIRGSRPGHSWISSVGCKRRHSMLLLFPARCPCLAPGDGVDDVSRMDLCTKTVHTPLLRLTNSSLLPPSWRRQPPPINHQKTFRRCQKANSSACSKPLFLKRRNLTKNAVSIRIFPPLVSPQDVDHISRSILSY
jgi:hypothetical protein